jgi:hypothetical protein
MGAGSFHAVSSSKPNLQPGRDSRPVQNPARRRHSPPDRGLPSAGQLPIPQKSSWTAPRRALDMPCSTSRCCIEGAIRKPTATMSSARPATIARRKTTRQSHPGETLELKSQQHLTPRMSRRISSSAQSTRLLRSFIAPAAVAAHHALAGSICVPGDDRSAGSTPSGQCFVAGKEQQGVERVVVQAFDGLE